MPLSGVRALGVIGSIIAVRVSARMQYVSTRDRLGLGLELDLLVVLSVAILDTFFPFRSGGSRS